MGLIHISKGTGKERHIVVSKPGGGGGHDVVKCSSKQHLEKEKISEDKVAGAQNVELPSQAEEEFPEDKESQAAPNQKEPDKIVCRHCSKSVIKANIQLHETHCLRMQRQKSAPKSADSSSKKHKDQSTPRAPNAHADVVARLERVDGDDLDRMIAAVQSVDRECSFKKCKTSTRTLGHNCEFCRRRFCLNHHIPEVHGCGDAAKAHARATIIREGVLYRGSGVPDKRPDPTRKAQLQKKLDKKLTDMATKRQGKKQKK